MKRGTFIILALSLIFAIPVFAGERVVVIVNNANSQNVDADMLRNIYSDNIIQWNNGKKIKSFNLPIKSFSRETFSLKILNMSAKNSAKEWANKKITNTAKNPPKTKKESLVIAFVAKYAEAIGYVSESAVKGKKGVKIILTIE